MAQKEFKFEMKPFSWDVYENGVPEMTPEEKEREDLINMFCYGTTEPLWK